MLERIVQFLLQILILVSVLLLWYLHRKIVFRWYQRDREEGIAKVIEGIGSAEDARKRRISREKKLTLLSGVPNMCIVIPIEEELVFRLPIIIIFSAISFGAWIGIFISAACFAIEHFAKFVRVPSLFFALEKSEHTGYETIRLNTTTKQIIRIILVFSSGILIGYYGIENQSILVSVGIHMAWNIVVMIFPFVLWFFLFPVYDLFLSAKKIFKSRIQR